jgi:hypothetical protein
MEPGAYGAGLFHLETPMDKPTPGKIPGYRTLSEEELAAVEATKRMESACNGFMDQLATVPDVDRRQLALGMTHMEEAFMHLVRAVTKPERLVMEMPRG